MSGFGIYLRKRRRLRDWSLRDLSRLSGVSPAALSDYERGAKDPRLGKVHKIARAFGESTTVFVGKMQPARRQRLAL